MDLKSAVEKYLDVVKGFQRPMALSEFGLPKQEVEAMISAWDEDYHLNRHFELLPPSTAVCGPPAAGVYRINGLPYSAILFRESIRYVLE